MLPSGMRAPAEALTVLCWLVVLRAAASSTTSPVVLVAPPADFARLLCVEPGPSPGLVAPLAGSVLCFLGWVTPGSTSPVDSLEPPFLPRLMGLVASIFIVAGCCCGWLPMQSLPTNQTTRARANLGPPDFRGTHNEPAQDSLWHTGLGESSSFQGLNNESPASLLPQAILRDQPNQHNQNHPSVLGQRF